MRRILWLLAVSAVLATASAADARPVCGTVRGDEGVRYRVIVERGPLRCRTARAVFADLFAGRGVAHPGATPGASYTQVGRWRCGYGMGQFACSRTGARQRISAVPRR